MYSHCIGWCIGKCPLFRVSFIGHSMVYLRMEMGWLVVSLVFSNEQLVQFPLWLREREKRGEREREGEGEGEGEREGEGEGETVYCVW